MKAWSIISRDAFKILKAHGVLTCNNVNLTQASETRWFSVAYQYMREAMKKKGLKPDNEKQYPLWVWTERSGEKGAEPNYLSDESFDSILLELEIPESELLQSSFELWEAVLNGVNFNKHWNDESASSLNEITESWSCVFNIDSYVEGYSPITLDDRNTQATCWKLTKEHVVKWRRYGINASSAKPLI
ncbi:DUF3841 domain-containing protein [Photobacterium kishitanii]|uniref:DUF3841 domain-containing protein n=1 Tax=Photobacterium kishitanii TaxID=318456 RepID=A0A2T3KLN8_9GAMM|nr:DUF3841 domain-containing protein [Photobacterium kishitanii]PSV00573.1 hypothetical protein C9J27_05405 [Photobacterium kishitanii]